MLCVMVASACIARLTYAQSCSLYSTDFGSFAGPPDFVQGELRVLWCVSSATIATSGFCPTGNAFKLDSSNDKPVVLIGTGTSGCTAIKVSFTYSQFAASSTLIKYGTTSATTASCTASAPNTLGVLSTTGGVCTTVNVTIPLSGATGIYFKFEHGANSNAVFIDDFTVERVGCCTTGSHPCCEEGSAGCADSTVASCVCAQDPFCCATQWDAQCVAEVALFSCGSCGGGGSGCLATLAVNFGTVYSGSSLCSGFPAVFERCEGAAPFLTSSLGCASSSDMAMRFSQGFPYSAAITRCVSLSSASAPALTFDYSKQSGTLGPRVDVSLDATTWTTAWTAPFTFEGACQSITLDLASLKGEASVWFRFASGSSLSNLATFDDIELIELINTPHECCVVGAPSCTDTVVSACTCAIDSYCCVTAWDEVCTALATIYCDAACQGLPVCGSPTAGNCIAAHASPACADATCCLSVCAIDVYCCDNEWDAACAAQASALCFAPGDINSDGNIDSIDLAIVLNQWGDSKGSADIDGNGIVDGGDLTVVLSNWTG